MDLPSEVRLQVLDQHAELREKMELLEETAHQSLATTIQEQALFAELTAFLRCLRDHMSFEDDALKRVLAEADPWGPERVARFEHDHEQQRRWIDLLADPTASREDNEFAFLTLGFLSVLRRDMEEEERHVLSADLLKDDPVVVHPEPE